MHYGGYFLSDPELSDADVLRFINNLKGGNFVDVYVVHQISTPLIVEDPNEVQIAQLLTPKKDQQPKVDKGKNKETVAPEVSLEDLDEDEGQGQGNEFSSYHLQTSDESDVDVDAEQSNFESLYDVVKNIDDLNEIPSGPVGIDVGFEDINKNTRGRYEGKLGGDDLYFNSSDPGSDISEDEGNPIEPDEVVDPLARNSTTKKNGYTTGTATIAIGGSGGATTSAASTSVTGGATGCNDLENDRLN
ncbi:hypothetical protein KY290_021881 [Solanum tuberosum]|uniref:Uncharacterized protein n=1 Tax=Solanum tuberosum TaxID=4113 RepID=A0ABQ7V2T1_SOLTU|nr:hypothetical protein KY289_022507 [Solanum tuberosum]KAH0693698.1 hypothetical protein KY285_020795 [Solanum tuberosum]KAH0758388.1 hypothetical protein KY290_021881 [Solanum tuberosum]